MDYLSGVVDEHVGANNAHVESGDDGKNLRAGAIERGKEAGFRRDLQKSAPVLHVLGGTDDCAGDGNRAQALLEAVKSEGDAGSRVVMRAVIGNNDYRTRFYIGQCGRDGVNLARVIRRSVWRFGIHGTYYEHGSRAGERVLQGIGVVGIGHSNFTTELLGLFWIADDSSNGEPATAKLTKCGAADFAGCA